MLDRIFSAVFVVPVLGLATVGVVAYLNLSDAQKSKEKHTVLLRQFHELDRDGDGGLSVSEAAARYRSEFIHQDFDQDGSLSREDFIGLRPAWSEYHKTERFKEHQAARERELPAIDRDGDRQLSMEEYVDHYITNTFSAMDADGDGKVSAAEYQGYRLAR